MDSKRKRKNKNKSKSQEPTFTESTQEDAQDAPTSSADTDSSPKNENELRISSEYLAENKTTTETPTDSVVVEPTSPFGSNCVSEQNQTEEHHEIALEPHEIVADVPLGGTAAAPIEHSASASLEPTTSFQQYKFGIGHQNEEDDEILNTNDDEICSAVVLPNDPTSNEHSPAEEASFHTTDILEHLSKVTGHSQMDLEGTEVEHPSTPRKSQTPTAVTSTIISDTPSKYHEVSLEDQFPPLPSTQLPYGCVPRGLEFILRTHARKTWSVEEPTGATEANARESFDKANATFRQFLMRKANLSPFEFPGGVNGASRPGVGVGGKMAHGKELHEKKAFEVEGARGTDADILHGVLESYESAVELDPFTLVYIIYLGNFHLYVGDTENAEACFSTVITLTSESRHFRQFGASEPPRVDLNPEDEDFLTMEALIGKGHVHLDLGQYELSASQYTKALEIDPSRTDVWNALGLALYSLENYENAIDAFKRCISIDPGYAKAYNNLGIVYAQKEEHVTAIEYFNRAVKIHPRFSEGWSNLASVHHTLGDKYGEKQCLRNAEYSREPRTKNRSCGIESCVVM